MKTSHNVLIFFSLFLAFSLIIALTHAFLVTTKNSPQFAGYAVSGDTESYSFVFILVIGVVILLIFFILKPGRGERVRYIPLVNLRAPPIRFDYGHV